jgi:hypothetical protein
VLAVGFLVLHLSFRTQETQQQELFRFSADFFRNFPGNIALAGNPLGVDSSTEVLRVGNRAWARDLGDWRTLAPIIGVVTVSVYLVAREWRRPSIGMLVVFWFYLALVPISLSPLLGALPRKAYIAGPPFALMLALAAVSIWDSCAALLARPNGAIQRAVYAGAPAVAGALIVVVMFALSFSIVHMTSDRFMAYETHYYGISSEDQAHLIGLIRDAYPAVPEGSRMDLRGLPPGLFIPATGKLEGRFIVALSLYYPNVGVVGSPDPAQIPEQPVLPRGTQPYVVVFECAQECQVRAACREVLCGGTRLDRESTS